MNTDRRNFLIQTASAAGVIGLGALLRETPASPERPGDAGRAPVEKPPCNLLKAALKKMAADGKPGIAVRIPVNPLERHAAGHILVHALNQDSRDSLEMFAEAVFVCLESDVLQSEIRGADLSHSVILFDGSRRAVAGLSLGFENAWRTFTADVCGLLHGKEDERLRLRAERVREKTDPALLAAVDRLLFEEDRILLSTNAAALTPVLVLERHRAEGSRRSSVLSEILKSYVQSADPKTPGPRLPFGVEATPERGGCGDACEEQPKDPGGHVRMVACGMARMGPDSRSFVRYLKS